MHPTLAAKSPLIQVMLAAVEAAADNTRAQKQRFSESVRIKPNEALSGRKDYVTGIDTSNQSIIFDQLRSLYPSYHCFGEELGADHAKPNPIAGDRQWVLDPIDSTRNLVAGTSDYSISLACQEFREGVWVTVAGVVAMPNQHKTVWAERGQGAHEITLAKTEHGYQSVERPVQVVKHHRTGTNAFDERAVEILSVKQGEGLELDLLHALHGLDRRIIRMIDSGAKALAEFGTERHGIITAGLTEPDKTAGLLIAQEAGAEMAEYQLPTQPGEAPQSGHTLHLVAADAEMLEAMKRLVERTLEARHVPIVPGTVVTSAKTAKAPTTALERNGRAA